MRYRTLERRERLRQRADHEITKFGITLRWEHKTGYVAAGAAALAVMLFLCICGGVNAGYALGAAVVFFLLLHVSISLPQHVDGLCAAVAVALSAWMTETLIQYLLLEEELRDKLSTNHHKLNILCCLAVYLVVFAASARPFVACSVSHVFLMLFAGIDYFVYQFRGNEFSFADVRAASTGISVASNYRFVIEDRLVYAVLLSVLYLALVRGIRLSLKHKGFARALSLSVAVLCCVLVGQKSAGTAVESWEQKGTYRNGYVLNFVLGIRDSFVAKPEGYSETAVQELEREYPAIENRGEKDDPTIIVIMNESFADLSVLSDGKLVPSKPVTPFLDSMNDNIIKGYALSSVFGAKTPDSEWEFLTGNSMAFLPEGSVPYQQYMRKKPYSLVSILKERGYTCMAVHPYYATGWSRNKVYPRLGFTEMYFLDSFDEDQLIRKYISDRQMYEKIIERYEEKEEGEKLFVMGVTMQNHGGYQEVYENFSNSVVWRGGYFPDVDQYLSLVRESDAALEYLIHYFEQTDERVEIVFFGDHQPSLNRLFYRTQNGKGLSGLTLEELEELFTVPFFVWTNYESETERAAFTSLNYLSVMTLERAGIALPPYQQFLKELQQEIPAMNARAYYSKAEGGFLHYEDAASTDRDWLDKYRILEYNNVFEKDKSSVFFP